MGKISTLLHNKLFVFPYCNSSYRILFLEMLRTSFVFAVLVFNFSCHNDPKPIGAEVLNNTNNSSTDPSENADLLNPVDSLRNPSNYFYLSDLPTKTIGELILADSIRAADNEVSFRCLDSLTSPNPSSRAFYFMVFKKIMNNPDGALSEVVGEFSKKYIEIYPKEFANYAASFSKPQMELWAFQTVEHVLAAVEEKQFKNAGEWTNKIIKNCKDCSAPELATIRSFNANVLRAAKDREEED